MSILVCPRTISQKTSNKIVRLFKPKVCERVTLFICISYFSFFLLKAILNLYVHVFPFLFNFLLVHFMSKHGSFLVLNFQAEKCISKINKLFNWFPPHVQYMSKSQKHPNKKRSGRTLINYARPSDGSVHCHIPSSFFQLFSRIALLFLSAYCHTMVDLL